MKKIELTQSKVALVDDEDFKWLNQFKWSATKGRSTWYAARYTLTSGEKQEKIYMHREILNAPKGIQVDHRNSHGLDNQRENLRLCTNQQNSFNRPNSPKNNNLGIKGVCWHKRDKKFRARIKINGKEIHLGYFNVLSDADSAYRNAETKYFGEFARDLK